MELKEKQNVRARMAQLRKAMDPRVAAARSALVQENVCRDPAWRSALSAGFYLPVRGEVDTLALCRIALATGRKLFLPRITDSAAHSMEFFACSDLEGLERGPFGLLQPPATTPAAQTLDLALVPGLAFDSKGARLGYGGGYYDRFFARLPVRRRLGLCFAFQIVERLPSDARDVPMNGICTEAGLQWL